MKAVSFLAYNMIEETQFPGFMFPHVVSVLPWLKYTIFSRELFFYWRNLYTMHLHHDESTKS